eukprot:TRINITY_DN10592_c0_g1_i1.p1 TRINITY_DN10592_c0_g1~~TRINITY_DN10592_c0_g1_i1.p1  ORF type:complete len:319 (-),score=57.05 TRINITY_DN10592_c0_g1_i1:278-1234(-)
MEEEMTEAEQVKLAMALSVSEIEDLEKEVALCIADYGVLRKMPRDGYCFYSCLDASLDQHSPGVRRIFIFALLMMLDHAERTLPVVTAIEQEYQTKRDVYLAATYPMVDWQKESVITRVVCYKMGLMMNGSMSDPAAWADSLEVQLTLQSLGVSALLINVSTNAPNEAESSKVSLFERTFTILPENAAASFEGPATADTWDIAVVRNGRHYDYVDGKHEVRVLREDRAETAAAISLCQTYQLRAMTTLSLMKEATETKCQSLNTSFCQGMPLRLRTWWGTRLLMARARMKTETRMGQGLLVLQRRPTCTLRLLSRRRS